MKYECSRGEICCHFFGGIGEPVVKRGSREDRKCKAGLGLELEDVNDNDG